MWSRPEETRFRIWQLRQMEAQVSIQHALVWFCRCFLGFWILISRLPMQSAATACRFTHTHIESLFKWFTFHWRQGFEAVRVDAWNIWSGYAWIGYQVWTNGIWACWWPSAVPLRFSQQNSLLVRLNSNDIFLNFIAEMRHCYESWANLESNILLKGASNALHFKNCVGNR